MRKSLLIFLVLLCPLAAASPASAAWQQRGVNLTAWWWYGYGLDDPSGVDQIKYNQRLVDNTQLLIGNGINSVYLIPTRYMSDCQAKGDASQQINITNKTISDASIVHAAKTIRSQYAQAGKEPPIIVLKPHVDCQDDTPARAQIRTNNDLAWWESYKAMMIHYAGLASDIDADMLVLGTELTSRTQAWPACGKVVCNASYVNNRWWDLIKAVKRTIIYKNSQGQPQFPEYSAERAFTGQLTFAADKISGVQAVKFWSGLDYLGVDAYNPLVSSEPLGDKLAAYSAGWKANIAALGNEAKRYKNRRGGPMQILLTEVGYPAGADAGSHPWGSSFEAYDGISQMVAYRALFNTLSSNPIMAGMSIWEWRMGDTAVPMVENTSLQVYKRPAEQLIKSWFLPPERKLSGQIIYTSPVKPGKTLRAQAGEWSSGTSSFVWQRCKTDCQTMPLKINAADYRILPSDVGYSFRLLETSSTTAGSLGLPTPATPGVVR